MKNYLLLSLLSICATPSIQSAECRELQEERREKERLERFEEESFSKLVASFTLEDEMERTRKDREYQLENLESQLTMNLHAIDQNTDLGEKARLQQKIIYVNEHIQTLKAFNFPQKNAKKLRTELQRKYDSCASDIPHASTKTPKNPSPFDSYVFQENIRQKLEATDIRGSILELAKYVIKGKNTEGYAFEHFNFCPNHIETPEEGCYVGQRLKCPKIKLLKEKYTAKNWQIWAEDSDPKRRFIKNNIFKILQELNTFDDKELIEGLEKVYSVNWECNCKELRLQQKD